MHFNLVLWQLLKFVQVNFKLHVENGCDFVSNCQDIRLAEEAHAVKHFNLTSIIELLLAFNNILFFAISLLSR